MRGRVAFVVVMSAVSIVALGGCSADTEPETEFYVFTNNCADEVIVFMSNAQPGATATPDETDIDFLYDNPRGSEQIKASASGSYLGPEYIPGRTILVTIAVKPTPAPTGGTPGTFSLASSRLTEENTGEGLLAGHPAISVDLTGEMCPRHGDSTD